MMIQKLHITITGTITMLLVLDWRLPSLSRFSASHGLFIRYNGKRASIYKQKYRKASRRLFGEMVAGQKVEKVFNHEAQTTRNLPPQRGVPDSGHQGPDLFRHDGSHHCGPVLCKLCPVSLCGRPVCDPVRVNGFETLASYLVYVRQSAMPMNQFTQQINFLWLPCPEPNAYF